jgi:hypothetical protein
MDALVFAESTRNASVMRNASRISMRAFRRRQWSDHSRHAGRIPERANGYEARRAAPARPSAVAGRRYGPCLRDREVNGSEAENIPWLAHQDSNLERQNQNL